MRRLAFSLSTIHKIVLSFLVLVFGIVYFVHAQKQPDTLLPPAIITFSSDIPAVTLYDLEHQQVTTHLSWYVANLPPEDSLSLQIYQLNEWGDEFPNETIAANESREITVQPPLGFAPPTYRLSILNKQKQIVEERTLTIPYDNEAMKDWHPQVVAFSSDVQNVNAGDLVTHKARINVSWQVENRPPNTNITFDQLLEDGSTIPVELSRPFLWLPSTSSGVVAPVLPQQSEDPVRLRLRVIDMTSGKTLDSAEVVVPVTGTSATATAVVNTHPPVVIAKTPLPTPFFGACGVSPLLVPGVAFPGDGCDHYVDSTVSVQINAFAFSNQHATEAIFGVEPRGDTVTASWSVSGSVQVLLEVYERGSLQPGITASPLRLYPDLPAVGSADILLNGGADGARVVLWAYDTIDATPNTPYRRLAYSIIDVPVLISASLDNCVPTFHFAAGDADPHGCRSPVERVTWQGAYEPFERGFMLWFSGTSTIYAMNKNGTYQPYVESTYATLPDNPVTDTPPAGYAKPVSGFGKVWGNYSPVHDALGWALGAEQPYTFTVESSSIATYFYVVLPDGQVAQLHNDYTWNYEAPS